VDGELVHAENFSWGVIGRFGPVVLEALPAGAGMCRPAKISAQIVMKGGSM
jgi:hypothetical protein